MKILLKTTTALTLVALTLAGCDPVGVSTAMPNGVGGGAHPHECGSEGNTSADCHVNPLPGELPDPEPRPGTTEGGQPKPPVYVAPDPEVDQGGRDTTQVVPPPPPPPIGGTDVTDVPGTPQPQGDGQG